MAEPGSDGHLPRGCASAWFRVLLLHCKFDAVLVIWDYMGEYYKGDIRFTELLQKGYIGII